MKLYSVLDVEGETFSPPMPAKNNAIAVRQFAKSLQAPGIDRDGYQLYLVGEMDEDTGRISPVDPERVQEPYSVAKDLTEVK